MKQLQNIRYFFKRKIFRY